MNVYDLKDRVAIVTGGAQGIGLAVASRILASGGKVCIWDRDKALLDETVKRLGKPDVVHGLPVDIADLAAVEAATKSTHRTFRQDRRPDQQRRNRRSERQHLGISA